MKKDNKFNFIGVVLSTILRIIFYIILFHFHPNIAFYVSLIFGSFYCCAVGCYGYIYNSQKE